MSKNKSSVHPVDRMPGGLYSGPVLNRLLSDDGTFPNNAILPLLVYLQPLKLPQVDPAAMVEGLSTLHRPLAELTQQSVLVGMRPVSIAGDCWII